jgi:peptide/nickel transport system substrate-binding protein/oligopeptide transport system substrate-binding protein
MKIVLRQFPRPLRRGLRCLGLWGVLCACGTGPRVSGPEGSSRLPEEGRSSPGEEGAPVPRDGPEYAETRPRPEVRDELTTVASSGELELDFRNSFLAGEAQLFTALYEGLFSYHPYTMEPIPALASRWELSEDKKRWTFTLREGARYQNGDPIRAEDFRSSWLSLLDPARDAPYSSLFDIIEGARDFRMGLSSNPKTVGVEAPDARTLVVRLVSPAAFFPSMLCHHSFSPIHPSLLNAAVWSPDSLVSNGPFYLESRGQDRLVLVKNERYWDASQVALRRIILRFTDDGDEAAALWNSGEARWISGDVNISALTDRSGIMVNAMFATHYYFIRSAKRPWSDHRIRRALSLALPWENIREGLYLPARTLIFPIRGYPELEGVGATNLEEAARLLTEAGYPQGAGLPELVIRLTPSQEAARVGGLMAGAWKDRLGVPVKIEVVPFGQYFKSLKRDDYGVGFSTWIGDFADPYTFLQMWRRDSNLNDARHSDEDYEKLMEKSMTEEGERRWETLAEAEKLLLDRGTVLPISYSPAVNIVDTDELDGWFPNVLDIHPFKYLSFKTLKPLPGVTLAPFPREGTVSVRN